MAKRFFNRVIALVSVTLSLGGTVASATVTVEFESFFDDIDRFNEYTPLPGPLITGGSNIGVGSSGGIHLLGRHALTYFEPITFPVSEEIAVSAFFKTGDLSVPPQGSNEILGQIYLTSESTGHPFQVFGSNTLIAGVSRYSDGAYFGIGARLANASIYPTLEQSLPIQSNRWYQIAATFTNSQSQSVASTLVVTDYGVTGHTSQGVVGSTSATIPSLSGALMDSTWHGGLAADADDGVDVDKFSFTVPDSGPPAIEKSILPTFDVQLRPGNAFPLGSATATTLDIDGGSGTSFPVLDVLMEFPLDEIPSGAKIQSASLMLDSLSNSSSMTIEALGYSGDGSASLSDESAATTIVGAKVGSFTTSGDIAIDLDVAFIESLLGETTHLGLRLKSATAGPWVRIATMEHATGIAPTLHLEYLTTRPGDVDQDGDVDGRDFLAWQRNPSLGDLADWQANYGVSSVTAAISVPEPTCSTLSMIVVLILAKPRDCTPWVWHRE